MRQKQQYHGFTIVELLIVIVIIAILSTITIVAYNGITQRAHTSASQSVARNVANKAEVYNTLNGEYPEYLGILTEADASEVYNLPGSAVEYVYMGSDTEISAPADGDPDNRVGYVRCYDEDSYATLGAKIYYWDYQNSVSVMTTTGTTSGANMYCGEGG